MYILSEQRDAASPNIGACFRSYREYLSANRERFPPAAYELASSDWYFDPHDHRSPHDAWLEEFLIREQAPEASNRRRSVVVTLRLLGAYQDGRIELVAPPAMPC